MRIARSVILVLLLAAFADPVAASGPAAVSQPLGTRVITVKGSGEVSVAPDEVVISLDIASFDPKLDVAKRGNDAAVERIFALAQKYSIPKRDIQTQQMSMQILRKPGERDYDDEYELRQSRPVIGYLVTRQMVVRLADLSRLEAFNTDLLESGDCEIKRVVVDTSQTRRHRDAARELAVRAAREKAVAMAATLGQTVGKAISITEENDYQGSNLNSTTSAGAYAGDAGLFAPGQVRINASVTISFELY